MDYKDKMNSYYNNERLEMHKYFHVHPNPKKVLDIGCGNGAFISKLIDKKDAEIWGIELMADQAKKAEKRLNKVLTGKIESHLEDLPPQYFDVIVCNDVLEHLENPFEVLKHLKHNLSEDGILISSIPNIRYFKVLKKVSEILKAFVLNPNIAFLEIVRSNNSSIYEQLRGSVA